MTEKPVLASPQPSAAHVAHVFDAADIFVVMGANLGDGLAETDELCHGDIYQLDPDATPRRLALAKPAAEASAPARGQVVALGSQIGDAGDHVALVARLVMMASDGERVELLLLRHRPQGRSSQATLYVLPLTPICPRQPYTLLAAEDPPSELRLSDLMCISFHRGTRIVLASGEQMPIEQLLPGMRVLTRDHGPQPIRWIGRSTLRAKGSFAPVVISAGTMGNEGDLIVGPHHRLFLYQRKRSAALPSSELLVQARHLVDGEKIYRREAGFAEYFSLVFDHHEVIYAEGIPVESLMVNEASVAALPPDLATDLRRSLQGLSQAQHVGLEPEPEPAQIPSLRSLQGQRT